MTDSTGLGLVVSSLQALPVTAIAMTQLTHHQHLASVGNFIVDLRKKVNRDEPWEGHDINQPGRGKGQSSTRSRVVGEVAPLLVGRSYA
jgi:hypothetical protein